MYDVTVIGNPLYSTIRTPTFSSQGRILSGSSPMISRILVEIGVEQFVMAGSISNQFRDNLANDLYSWNIPEFLAIENDNTAGFDIVCKNGVEEKIALIDPGKKLGIKEIPDEFLDTKYIVIVPEFQEIDYEFVKWVSNTTSGKIVLDPLGMMRKAGSDGLVSTKIDESLLEKLARRVDTMYLRYSFWNAIDDDPLLVAERIVECGSQLSIVGIPREGNVVYDGSDFIVSPLSAESVNNGLYTDSAFLGTFVAASLRSNDLIDNVALSSSVSSLISEQECNSFKIDTESAQRRKAQVINELVIK